MLIDVDFKQLGPVPDELIQDFSQLVLGIDWTKNEFNRGDPLGTQIVRVPYGIRQERFHEQTDDVKTILKGFVPIDQWMHEKFPNHIFVKCEIACLLPNHEVGWHLDPCWWHQHSHRVHVPIVSNPDCFWRVEDREHYLAVGGYYEINNRRFHSYYNRGTTLRLHLIFDILEHNIYHQAQENGIDLDEYTGTTKRFSSSESFFQALPDLLKENYF